MRGGDAPLIEPNERGEGPSQNPFDEDGLANSSPSERLLRMLMAPPREDAVPQSDASFDRNWPSDMKDNSGRRRKKGRTLLFEPESPGDKHIYINSEPGEFGKYLLVTVGVALFFAGNVVALQYLPGLLHPHGSSATALLRTGAPPQRSAQPSPPPPAALVSPGVHNAQNPANPSNPDLRGFVSESPTDLASSKGAVSGSPNLTAMEAGAASHQTHDAPKPPAALNVDVGEAPLYKPAQTVGKQPNILTTDVQIGAYASPDLARRGWAFVQGVAASEMSRKGLKIEPVSRDGKMFYRALATGFSSKDDALAFCAELKAKGVECILRFAKPADRH